MRCLPVHNIHISFTADFLWTFNLTVTFLPFSEETVGGYLSSDCYSHNYGNLISTTDLQGKEDNTFAYDGNNQLIRQTDVGGGKIYYGYDLTRPTQLNAVTSGGVTTGYSYDSRGNVTSSRTMNTENETNNHTEKSYIISHT